ncbi:MAG: hypothetical protein KAI81_08135 [Candidatus Marinimicrobia bacterium]|nr:hypothetical protein [Candidatus Neomarinimicrobiota bacterium]
MIYYDDDIKKNMTKGKIPKNIVKLFHNAFTALDVTKDMNLFDIKKLQSESETEYFRLRKGKYRAIFKLINWDFYVLDIAKRAEVYRKWP